MPAICLPLVQTDFKKWWVDKKKYFHHEVILAVVANKSNIMQKRFINSVSLSVATVLVSKKLDGILNSAILSTS